MKQILCVFIAFCLITWILLSNISSADYGYDQYYSEYEYETESAYYDINEDHEEDEDES